jgi:hypothetical protein
VSIWLGLVKTWACIPILLAAVTLAERSWRKTTLVGDGRAPHLEVAGLLDLYTDDVTLESPSCPEPRPPRRGFARPGRAGSVPVVTTWRFASLVLATSGVPAADTPGPALRPTPPSGFASTG